jgi:hypothetical protein
MMDEGAIESGEIKDWDDYKVIRFIKEDLDEYYDDDEDYFQRASEIGLKYDNKKKSWSGYLGGYMAIGGITDPDKYPELRKIADKIADDTAERINRDVKDVKSKMPYKAQWVLEEVVRDLENRI